MSTYQTNAPETDGPALLTRLFGFATERLLERNIGLVWDHSVLEYLLRPDDGREWQSSLNPLLALQGVWDRRIGDVIMQMMVDKKLRAGQTIAVATDPSLDGERLCFQVAASD